MDGAGPIERFIRIDFPLIRKFLLVALIFRLIDLFRIFDVIYVMTSGGPASATETISYYIYRTGILFFDVGYAAVMGLALAFVMVLLSRSPHRHASGTETGMKGSRNPGQNPLLTSIQVVSLAVASIFSLFPIFWIVITSVKLPRDYFSETFIWIPDAATLGHYQRLFSDLGGLGAIGNSLIVASATTVLTLLISIPAAYAIANARRGPLRSAPVVVLALRALPPVILLIPLFLVFVEVGLLDTYLGLVLAFSTFNVPFTIWLLKGFFEDFPKEVQDAARLDGLSELKSVIYIVLPMIRPALMVVAFFAFLASWNELMMSVTFTGQERRTVTKLIASLLQSPTGTEFGAAAAISFISMVPGIILVVVGQRFLIKGVTGGSVK